MIFNLIIIYLFIGIFGYLISKLFLKNLTIELRIVLSFALGFGFISLVMILLGLIYTFDRITTSFVLLSILIFLVFKNRKQLQIPSFKIQKLDTIFFVISLPFFLLAFFHIIFFPELYHDSMIYNYVTKLFLLRNKIEFLEGGPTIGLGFASNYPPAYQLLGIFIYLFTGENLFFLRLTSLFISFLLLLLVYYWSREIFKKKLSIYSILLFISLPGIIFFSRSTSQYIYLTFQFSLACYFLHKFLLGKNTKNLYLSSIFAGFAGLTSYLGLLFIFILFLCFLFKKKYKEVIKSIFLFFLIISPWYLRNLIILGNPIWPFLGGKYINPLIQLDSFEQLNKISKTSGFNYETIKDLNNSFMRLFFFYINYLDASNFHVLNPVFTLLAIPAIIYWVKNRNKNVKFFVLWFLIILILYIIGINYWNKYLILISVPTIFLSLYFINSLKKIKVVKWILNFFFIFLYFNTLYLSFFWDECPSKKILNTFENLGEYQKILEICYGDYAKLWKWVNENIPENETIATNDYRFYYYNKTILELSSWKLKDLYYSSGINESREIFKKNKINYIVLVTNVKEIEKYSSYFELIKEINGKKVYKLP